MAQAIRTEAGKWTRDINIFCIGPNMQSAWFWAFSWAGMLEPDGP